MIPGEIFAAQGDIILNAEAPVTTLLVANTGDRPVTREVRLIPFQGARKVFGFNGKVMGEL